jgi:tetratricopeptide (TPR) repeat protein
MRNVYFCLAAAFALVSPVLRAEDAAATARGLAQAAAGFAKADRMEEAKLYYYKALFLDENCGDALYELAPLLAKSGDTVNALNFFVRANQELKKLGDPLSKAKALECEKQILKLSPYASQFNATMADYAQDLGKIAAKASDSVTLEVAQERVSTLNLPQLVPGDKLPQSLRDLAKAAKEAKKDKEMAKQRSPFERDSKPPPAQLTPDVERALKAAGWTTITGKWVKKSEGVYEVTDGKVEAAVVNGVMQVTVLKGGSGVVRAFVRAYRRDWIGDPDFKASARDAASNPSGFGYIIKDNEAKQYIATGNWLDDENNNSPDLDKTIQLPAGAPENVFMMQVNGDKYEGSVNGGASRKTTMKISHDGPFQVNVVGTMTIKLPRVAGQ